MAYDLNCYLQQNKRKSSFKNFFDRNTLSAILLPLLQYYCNTLLFAAILLQYPNASPFEEMSFIYMNYKDQGNVQN